MTRQEFDTWIEEYRQDLVNIAVSAIGARDAEDAVSDMIAGAYANETYLRCDTKPTTWFLQAAKGYAANRRRGRGRATVAHDEVEYLSSGFISGERTKPAPRAD